MLVMDLFACGKQVHESVISVCVGQPAGVSNLESRLSRWLRFEVPREDVRAARQFSEYRLSVFSFEFLHR